MEFGFQIDYRIGGQVTGILGDGKLTLVPDEVRKCVAFACIRTLAGTIPIGTAFLVAVPFATGNSVFLYFVTAKHVILGAKEQSPDGFLYLRVNLRIGGTLEMRTTLKAWLFHPTDESADVAVIPFALDPEVRDKFDSKALPINMCATEAIIAKEAIGIGDNVFLTGLFTARTGQKRNIPILRLGSIAAMPEEPVRTMFGDTEAYLIEVRSIGGLSGSPVFVHLGLLRERENGGLEMYSGTDGLRTTSGPYYLLGLVHGHWDSGDSEEDMIAKDARGESINLGIAIVVPATKILEVINQPRLQEFRKSIEDGLARGRAKPDVS